MFFNKFIIVFLLFFFCISSWGMDFSDDGGGMNFGGDEVKTTKKIKKSKKSKRKKRRKTKKKSKKKVVKKAPKEDTGMTFGEETKTDKKEDSGMNFGEDAKTEKKSEGGGMDFGDDGGMTFGEEEAGSDGKLEQKEMNFDIAEVEKEVKGDKKEDKVKIKKKVVSYVEKGVFFKLSSGTTLLLDPKISKDSKTDEKSLLGFTTNLSLGYDINPALSMELYTQFIFNQAQIKGESDILYSRDLNSRTIGLGVNYNVINRERTNLHINLHGGLLMIDSSLDIEGIKIAAGGLIGFEYYMLLRHFSTSLSLSSDYMTGYDTIAVSFTASLKYSF